MQTLKQIAQELNTTKTRVENWVKIARQEHPDRKLGTNQGNGKPKLYSDDERELILSYAPTDFTPTTPTEKHQPENKPGQLAKLNNPFLNGVDATEAIDGSITDIETRIDLLETRKIERSQFQTDLSSRIKTLALKGYRQGILESESEKDELALAYEQAAQAEIERIEREQQLEAIRAQARADVKRAFEQSKSLGKS